MRLRHLRHLGPALLLPGTDIMHMVMLKLDVGCKRHRRYTTTRLARERRCCCPRIHNSFSHLLLLLPLCVCVQQSED